MALLTSVWPPVASTSALPAPATLSPPRSAASSWLLTAPVLPTRFTRAAVLITVPTVSPSRSLTNALPASTFRLSVLTIVSSRLPLLPIPVPALRRKLPALTLMTVTVSSPVCPSTIAPLAPRLTLPKPVVITPTVMSPASACIRTLPPAVLNWASPAILTPRPACTSIVCPLLPCVCTLGWPLAASASLTTTASAANRLMLPWLVVMLLLIVKPATADEVFDRPACSSTLPTVPVAMMVPASVSAPSPVCTTKLAPVPDRLTLFSVSAVASDMYRPPLVMLVAAMELTCVCSAAVLLPIPVAALNVTSAVSPMMFRLLPVRPLMMQPSVAVRPTSALALITLSVILPVSANILTSPVLPVALTELAFLSPVMVIAVLA